MLALALAAPAEAQTADRWREERQRLVADELVPQGITDSLTLAAMRAVPRHEFVPEDQRAWARGCCLDVTSASWAVNVARLSICGLRLGPEMRAR